MSKTDPRGIKARVDSDGDVMISATDLVEYIMDFRDGLIDGVEPADCLMQLGARMTKFSELVRLHDATE